MTTAQQTFLIVGAGLRDQPTPLLAKTIKAKGVPEIEHKNGWHGKALLPDMPSGPSPPSAGPATSTSRRSIQPRGRGHHADPAATIALPSYRVGEKVATRVAFGAAITDAGGVAARSFDHRPAVRHRHRHLGVGHLAALRGVGRNRCGDGRCVGGPGRSTAAGVGRRVSVDADHQRIPWRGCDHHRGTPAT